MTSSSSYRFASLDASRSVAKNSLAFVGLFVDGASLRASVARASRHRVGSSVAARDATSRGARATDSRAIRRAIE